MKGSFRAVQDLKSTNEHVRRFEQVHENLVDHVAKAKMSSGKRLKVICKADLWINNFLFKSNEKQEVTDVKFVDAQTTFIGSPVLDVLDLLCKSTTPQLR